MTRFDVPSLAEVTGHLAAVAAGREAPDLVITGARVLSVYTERILPDREIWISRGRIAAIRPAGDSRFGESLQYDAGGGILAPGLVDAHVHIESSMMTACAYAEVALLNGTTTIFCDSHEIGNVCDHQGVEWMLEDARRAPLNIFLTVPSTIPATHAGLETAGGDLTPAKIGALFDEWPEAVALGEKMDFIQVVDGASAVMPYWRRRSVGDVPSAGTFTVARLLRPMLRPGSLIPTKRLTERSLTNYSTRAFGSSFAAARRPPHGTVCRKQ
jgi:adenine deaminase